MFESSSRYQGKNPSLKRFGFFYFMEFTVYILYSEKHSKHYTGFTSNLESRLTSHNELGNKDWTIKYRPWKLIYTEIFLTKTEATKKEKWLKSGIGREFVKSIEH
jgi:putative endonuclease